MKKISTLIAFMTLCFTYAKAQYCVPTITQCFEHITNLTLNTINNTSTGNCGSTTNAYSDYTTISTSLTQGQTYTLTVTLSGQYQADSVDVWIDYDHNQAFDNSEYVGEIFGYTQGSSPIVTRSTSFTVPLGASLGNTRLRARVRDGGSNATPSPCGLQQYGEAEDYTINILSNLTPCTGTPQAPVISTASPAFACPSSTFTISATDPNTTSGITYQWQTSTASTGPWANVSTGTGGTTLSYTTPTVVSTNYYRLIAKCTGSGLSSAPSSVVSVAAGTTATITANPANETICEGSSTLFAVTATGTLPAYQWQVNDGTGFTNISDNATYTGSTSTILSVNNATATMNGYTYRCVVIANACSPSATSGSATLTVRTAPSIISAPASQHACPGNNTQFSVTASGSPTLTYQWQLSVGTTYSNITNNATYSGATTATLSVNNVSNTMNGYSYRCVVSGACSPSATSASAILTIGLGAQSIVATGNTTICDGSIVYLSTPALTGYTYQWYNGVNMIFGATDATYGVTAQGNYHVVVTASNGCSGTSNSIFITVNPTPETPNISANGDTTFCLGSGVLLISDVISGLPTQWLLNNGTILGETGLSYNATDSGYYAIQVTGTDGCTATSAPVHTVVYDLPLPVVATTGDYTMCVANSNQFVSYQWYNNGQQIPGANSSCYTATVDGSYSVLGIDELHCSKMSFPMEVSHVGVNNLNAVQEAVKIYPNPASSVVKVDAPVAVSLSVSSIDGRVMYYEKNVKAMDISGLSTGVYMITVYDLNNTVLKIEKLVKE